MTQQDHKPTSTPSSHPDGAHLAHGTLPRHIAIIMDGNGRWAELRGEPRNYGHQQGVESVRKTLRVAAREGVEYLTLYTFSEENWQRPAEEVNALMALLVSSIHNEVEELEEMGVRLRFMGDQQRLSSEVRHAIQVAEQSTAHNSRIELIIALSYSARSELLHAFASAYAQGDILTTDGDLQRHLYLPHLPYPDLLIRTGGEKRISNFMLWQIAYSELYFTDTLWPDFDEACFAAAIHDYSCRQRRYGRTGHQVEQSTADTLRHPIDPKDRE